jgi:hypothetical protein
MWAKGAAVGNASRCPRARPVRRRRIVHMSMACRARSARPPRGRRFSSCRAQVSAVAVVALLSCPRIKSFAFSARQALMRRCSVRSCALPA